MNAIFLDKMWYEITLTKGIMKILITAFYAVSALFITSVIVNAMSTFCAAISIVVSILTFYKQTDSPNISLETGLLSYNKRLCIACSLLYLCWEME